MSDFTCRRIAPCRHSAPTLGSTIFGGIFARSAAGFVIANRNPPRAVSLSLRISARKASKAIRAADRRRTRAKATTSLLFSVAKGYPARLARKGAAGASAKAFLIAPAG